MNTLELLSSLEGCKIVKREDGVIEIIPEVEVKEALNIKEGDFIYCEESNHHKTWVAIVDRVDDDWVHVKAMRVNRSDTGFMATVLRISKLCYSSDETLRFATEEEKQLLLDALHKERKIWNQETLQIEEDKYPRIGDKCVFWNEGYMDVVVSNLYDLDVEASQYNTDESGPYENCVRLQDFNFETMAPKHEK